jgi:hypothetical protein
MVFGGVVILTADFPPALIACEGRYAHPNISKAVVELDETADLADNPTVIQ